MGLRYDVAVASLLFVLTAFMFACERVDVGNVGTKQAIDQSLAQTQEAQRAQYRVKQVEAEAAQNVAKANGEAGCR